MAKKSKVPRKTSKKGTVERKAVPKFQSDAVRARSKVKRLLERVENMSKEPGMPPMVFMAKDYEGDCAIIRYAGTQDVKEGMQGQANALISAFDIKPAAIEPCTDEEVINCRQIDLEIDPARETKDKLKQAYRQVVLDKDSKGCRQVWGHESMKPSWWLEDVPFRSPTHKEEGSESLTITRSHMERTLEAFTAYIRQEISSGKKPVKSLEENDDMIKELQLRIETKKPDTKPPKTKQPETKQPETKQPETKQPETKQPEAKQAEAKQQETKQHETKQPEAKRPAAKQPEANQPDAKRAKTNKPEREAKQTESEPKEPTPSPSPASTQAYSEGGWDEDVIDTIPQLLDEEKYDQVGNLLKVYRFLAANIILTHKKDFSAQKEVPVADHLDIENPEAQQLVPPTLKVGGIGSIYRIVYPERPMLLRILVCSFALEHLGHYVKQYQKIGYIEEHLPEMIANEPIQDYLLRQAFAVLEGGMNQIQLMFLSGFMGCMNTFYTSKDVFQLPPCPCQNRHKEIGTYIFVIGENCAVAVPLITGKKKRNTRRGKGTKSDPIDIESFAQMPGCHERPLKTWEKVDIYQRSLDTLAPAEWLDDTIVDVSLSFFAHKKADICILPSIMAQKLFVDKNQQSMSEVSFSGYNFRDALEYFPEKRGKRTVKQCARAILLPACNGLHWWLYVAYPETQQVVVCDSMGARHKGQTQSVQRFFHDVYDKEFTVSHATVPRQRNGFDCGVHTIMTAKSVIELKKVPDWPYIFKSRELTNTAREELQKLFSDL